MLTNRILFIIGLIYAFNVGQYLPIYRNLSPGDPLVVLLILMQGVAHRGSSPIAKALASNRDYFLATGVFFCLCFLSAVFSNEPITSVTHSLQFIFLYWIFFLAVGLRADGYRSLIHAMIVQSTTAGVLTLLFVLFGLPTARYEGSRIFTLVSGPGSGMAAAIAGAYLLFRSTEAKGLRRIGILGLYVLSSFVILEGNRAGLLIWLLALALFCLESRKTLLPRAAVVLAAAFLLFLQSPNNMLNRQIKRFSFITESYASSDTVRYGSELERWHSLFRLKELLSDQPFAVRGLGTSQSEFDTELGLRSGTGIHNAYFELWYEIGPFGLFSYLVVIFLLFRKIVAAFKRDGDTADLRFMAFVLATLFGIVYWLHPYGTAREYNLIPAIAVGFCLATSASPARKDERPTFKTAAMTAP